MDRQLLERMIGAVVLIALLVIVAPALLDGPDPQPSDAPQAAVDDDLTVASRRHEMRLREEPENAPVARELPARASEQTPEPEVMPEPESEPSPDADGDTPPESVPAAPAAQGEAAADAAREPEEPEPVEPAPAPAADLTPGEKVPTEGWSVQLGSFSNRDNARRLADDVIAQGFEAFLMSLERDGQTLYRVRVGPRPDRSAAEQLAVKLADAGYMGRPVPQSDAE